MGKKENLQNKYAMNEPYETDRLRRMTLEELYGLCADIRTFLIESVSKTGGHLASNLGVVELTVMLHRCFDFSGEDRLVFDVGHQSYVHKILTGRGDAFDTLRQIDGLSGYPKRCEHAADLFDTGHAGTAISLADGIAAAKRLRHEGGMAVAVVGDGAITNGLCYEALNNIGGSGKKVLLVLNDNGMSISENVGAVAKLLTRMRTSKSYSRAKRDVKGALHAMPNVGSRIEKRLRHIRDCVKMIMMPGAVCEGLGIKYFGPVDGHDLKKLDFYIRRAKETDGPVMLHVKTVKGRGYSHAEEAPDRFHGVSRFEVDNGTTHSLKADFSQAAGMELTLLGMKHKDMAVVCPAMTKGCGLAGFAESFPDRFFDCGIAEGHAVTFAAALAREGLIPVVCTYSSFFQRAYDQMWHDVSLNGFHVVFCLDRAGYPGADGETHQGIYDLSYLGTIPHMAVLSPSSFAEQAAMLRYAVEQHSGPIALRYPHSADTGLPFEGFTFGKAQIVREGTDLTVCAEGVMLKTVLEAAEEARKEGVSVEVLKLSTVYPLDTAAILASREKTGRLMTVEANIQSGGMGEHIAAALGGKTEILAFPNQFMGQGKPDELMKRFGLDKDALVSAMCRLAGGAV